jgi:predicted membrane chloride channel (bestrophin family)
MIDLSAPKVITFILSVVIALAAVVIHYAHISIPFSHSGFSILLVAYVVLAVGNLFRDI